VLRRSSLPGGVCQIFLAKLPRHVLVRYRPTGLGISPSARYGLQHVQMVLHIIQAAVVGQSVKKLSDGLLRLQFLTSREWDLG